MVRYVQKPSKRVFNTTGICDPAVHYMVDLTQRLYDIRKLVDEGKYFTINRARQFGKTTTLHALAEYLGQDYLVISMDFQMQMSDAKFRSEHSFSVAFARAFENSFRSMDSDKQSGIFGFLKDYEGQVAIANRIFEIWFYNLFIAQDAIDSKTYDAGQKLKE